MKVIIVPKNNILYQNLKNLNNFKKKIILKYNYWRKIMANDNYTFSETLKSELYLALLMFIPLTFTITGLF